MGLGDRKGDFTLTEVAFYFHVWYGFTLDGTTKQWHVKCKTDVTILQLPALNQDHSKSLGREVWMHDLGVICYMHILFESIHCEIT